MEVRCRTPTELKRIDDGGVFDRLLREAEEGDDALCEVKLSRRVVVQLLKRVKGPSREDLFMFPICRKRRTPRPHFGLIAASDDPSMPLTKRRRFDIEPDDDPSDNPLMLLADVAIASSIPSTRSRKPFEPELEEEKKKQNNNNNNKKRKKAIRYSPEELEQLKQKGLNLPLPEEVRVLLSKLGGSTHPVRLVIKYLYQTDLSEYHGRFNLPETTLVSAEGVLTEEDWTALHNDQTRNVRLVGPMCREPTSMILKRWKMRTGSVPVLMSGWAKFLKKYHTEYEGVLREGDGVQVWASRCDDQGLLLALQVIHRAPAAGDDNHE